MFRSTSLVFRNLGLITTNLGWVMLFNEKLTTNTNILHEIACKEVNNNSEAELTYER